MYQVATSGETHHTFMSAVKAAATVRSNVVEVSTGLVRWSPAPLVSKKRVREYQNHVAAYQAQQARK